MTIYRNYLKLVQLTSTLVDQKTALSLELRCSTRFEFDLSKFSHSSICKALFFFGAICFVYLNLGDFSYLILLILIYSCKISHCYKQKSRKCKSPLLGPSSPNKISSKWVHISIYVWQNSEELYHDRDSITMNVKAYINSSILLKRCSPKIFFFQSETR